MRRLLPFLLPAVLLTGCSPSDQPADRTGRGILVLAIDGLRADHVSALGYELDTTPALDALAAEGVIFSQAFSTSPQLLPAHVPLVTGCDPNVARRRYLKDEFAASVEERWRIPDKVPHLAVELLVGGFATGAFVDHTNLAPAFGFDPGFQRYVVSDTREFVLMEEAGVTAVSDRFLQWVRSLDRRTPWFAYVHLHDLERMWRYPDPRWESGYFQPDPEKDDIPPVGAGDSVFFAVPRSRWRGGPRTVGEYVARYDGHLRGLDAELARVFQSLRVLGRYDNTTIVVVGTHGVQFGEAGLYLTSGRHSLADVHVPWILRSPAVPPERRGGRIDHVASLLDVAPTLLEISRVPVPRGMHGVSQLSVIRDADAAPVRDYAFSTCGLQVGGAAFGPRWVYEVTLPGIVRGMEGDRALRRSWFGDDLDHSGVTREIFYDRFATPFPPLSSSGGARPPEADAMRNAAASWEDNLDRTRKVLQGGTLMHDPTSPEMVAELQALGFLGDDV